MRIALSILLLILLLACTNHQATENDTINGAAQPLSQDSIGNSLAAIPIGVYNGDSIVSTQAQSGYLYIKKHLATGKPLLVADNVELTIVIKGYHTCHSHCIYYDSIVGINSPGLQMLKGQLMATIFKDEESVRDSANALVPKTAKGKIWHKTENSDKYSLHGLVFIED